jgi:tRNA-dihydrouridine synthase A
LFGEQAAHRDMKSVFEALIPYITSQLEDGVRLHAMTRHFVGAFHGVRGARAFRRHLSTHGVKPGAGIEVLREAMALVEDEASADMAA